MAAQHTSFFDHAVVLDQVMHQSGDDNDQVVFRNVLLHLRNGQVTQEDWQHLMKQTPAQVQDLEQLRNALAFIFILPLRLWQSTSLSFMSMANHLLQLKLFTQD